VVQSSGSSPEADYAARPHAPSVSGTNLCIERGGVGARDEIEAVRGERARHQNDSVRIAWVLRRTVRSCSVMSRGRTGTIRVDDS
jgi:hypothetical protein